MLLSCKYIVNLPTYPLDLQKLLGRDGSENSGRSVLLFCFIRAMPEGMNNHLARCTVLRIILQFARLQFVNCTSRTSSELIFTLTTAVESQCANLPHRRTCDAVVLGDHNISSNRC